MRNILEILCEIKTKWFGNAILNININKKKKRAEFNNKFLAPNILFFFVSISKSAVRRNIKIESGNTKKKVYIAKLFLRGKNWSLRECIYSAAV